MFLNPIGCQAAQSPPIGCQATPSPPIGCQAAKSPPIGCQAAQSPSIGCEGEGLRISNYMCVCLHVHTQYPTHRDRDTRLEWPESDMVK